mmetsp:Transcript_79850/g.156596  ORF Transcript_79850/g.156596 Transcript_79850/m.156596 type:complete len:184 (+) Transcript_79850:219-770(+)
MLGVESVHRAPPVFVLPTEAAAAVLSRDATKALEISFSAQPTEAANDANMMVAISLLLEVLSYVLLMVEGVVVASMVAINRLSHPQNTASNMVVGRSVRKMGVKRWLVVEPSIVLHMGVEFDANWLDAIGLLSAKYNFVGHMVVELALVGRVRLVVQASQVLSMMTTMTAWMTRTKVSQDLLI